MITKTLAEIAAMAGGRLTEGAAAETRVCGVSKDTRTMGEGNLYVPLIGESFDGHDFVAAAFEQGAAAAFWQIDHTDPPAEVPLIVVDDTLGALQRLAKAYRRELPVRIVGITGSNGKTTTKDMTAAVLSAAFEVHKTAGNYNNHIGLPMTLLQLSHETEVAVLEMGMSGRWEIDLLSRLAEPEVAVITNIGEAHLLQLGSRKEIARAKTEILAGLQAGGLLVYNGDEPLIEEVLPELSEPGRMQNGTYTAARFGTDSTNDYYPLRIDMDEQGTRFTVNTDPDTTFRIPALGAHNAVNALAAIAVGKHFGMKSDLIAQGLSEAVMTGMRIELVQTTGGMTLLNDAYNASPASMRAAIGLLHEMQGYRKKFAVLGDMLELGDREADFHREVGGWLDPGKVEAVYLYGPLALHMAEGARERFSPDRVRHFMDKEELARELSSRAAAQDLVLIKGSRGMKMEQVAASLMK